MSKITNFTRECIVLSAIQVSFDPVKQKLNEEEDALMAEAYSFIYSATERRISASLPAGWLKVSKALTLNVDGRKIELKGATPLPVRYDHGREHGSIPAGDLASRINAHAEKREDVKVAIGDARSKLSAMLSSISTMKKLQEVWPEGLPFYERFLNQQAILPPAVRVEDVNKSLGIK